MDILKHLDLTALNFNTFIYVLIIIIVYCVSQRVTLRQLKELLGVDKEEDFRKRFKNQINNTETVNHLLDHLLYDLNADRIYIFQYHNGGVSIAGIPFARCSNTHERCQVGVAPNINLYQQLPLAMYGFRHDLIAGGHLIVVNNLDAIRESDISSYNLMKTQGIKSLYIMGMFSMDDTPMGFLGVDFLRDGKELTVEQLEDVKLAAQKISGCLENI